MSTTSRGLKRATAYHSASASSMRPSASVSSTSMVCPDSERTMSPGRQEFPSSMFSASGSRPTALTGVRCAASTCISPNTAAAPAMSNFMMSMPGARLSDTPPVSKVTPLPTKASGGCAFAPPFHVSTTSRDSFALPRPTARSAWKPFASSAASSMISTPTPSGASDWHASANAAGSSTLGGSFTRSRASQMAFARASRPANRAAASPVSRRMTSSASSVGVSPGFSFVR